MDGAANCDPLDGVADAGSHPDEVPKETVVCLKAEGESQTVWPGPIDAVARRQGRATIRREIHQNAAFTVPFLVMNTLATIVACYGLLEDSSAVVIGAMIIAMLLGPISGIALALVDGNTDLLRRALIAEGGGAIAVLCVSFTIGLIHRDIPITHEILSRTAPNLLDLMIALAGGAAGAYATVSPRLSVGLVGVAIATALVPPLATCGICLARHESVLAWGGFLLFFTNFVAIQLASSVVMWLSGFHDLTDTQATARTRRGRLLVTNGISVVVFVLLTFVMVKNFVSSSRDETFKNSVQTYLTAKLGAYPGVHLADVTFSQNGESESIIAVVRTPYSFSPERVARIENGMPSCGKKHVELEIMSVIVKETNREGYLHDEVRASSLIHGAGGTDRTSRAAPVIAEPTGATDSKVFGP